MVEERTYNELRLELKQLSESNPEIDYSDEIAYYDKCKFLDDMMARQSQTGIGHEMSKVFFSDFFSEIFEREVDGDRFWEPYQLKDSPHYTQWLEEEKRGITEHDYKRFEEPRFDYNPLVFYKTKRKDRKEGARLPDGTANNDRNNYKVVTKGDWETMTWLEERYFALTAPMTFVGKANSAKNARFLYAFTVDLDDVGMNNLIALCTYFMRPHKEKEYKGLTIVPVPNLIVNSGHGFHLYYILERPLAMYSRNARYAKQILQGIYDIVCIPGKTTQVKKPHCLGIYHMFRLPDTLTKPLRKVKGKEDGKEETVGVGVPIRCWKFHVKRYTLSKLMKYFVLDPKLKEITPAVIKEMEGGARILGPKHLTREQALQKYGKLLDKNQPKGYFTFNRALYDKWLERFKDARETGVRQGHRYYCIMMLAALAKKCNVSFQELQEDAKSLIDTFDGLTLTSDNHFKENDVIRALKAYNSPDVVRWSKFMLQNWTGIEMPNGIKRNKRKQAVHLARTRAAQAAEDTEGKWRENNGRKHETIYNSTIAAMIRQWMEDHPGNENKSQCARDLTEILQEERKLHIEERLRKGRKIDVSEKMMTVSRTTVTKWWNLIIEDLQIQEDDLAEDYDEEGFAYEDWLTNQELMDGILAGVGIYEGEEMKIPDIE